MKLINRIPGPLLIFLGAFCLSFGGLIVKSFENANLWQILFWRLTFFTMIVTLYLLISYKKKFIISFYNSGLSGFIDGFTLSIGFPDSPSVTDPVKRIFCPRMTLTAYKIKI